MTSETRRDGTKLLQSLRNVASTWVSISDDTHKHLKET